MLNEKEANQKKSIDQIGIMGMLNSKLDLNLKKADVNVKARAEKNSIMHIPGCLSSNDHITTLTG